MTDEANEDDRPEGAPPESWEEFSEDLRHPSVIEALRRGFKELREAEERGELPPDWWKSPEHPAVNEAMKRAYTEPSAEARQDDDNTASEMDPWEAAERRSNERLIEMLRRSNERMRETGQIGVVSTAAGQICLVDPSYLGMAVEEFREYNERAGGHFDGTQSFGYRGQGLVFKVDENGHHPVYVRRTEDGRIASIKIVLIEEDGS